VNVSQRLDRSRRENTYACENLDEVAQITDSESDENRDFFDPATAFAPSRAFVRAFYYRAQRHSMHQAPFRYSKNANTFVAFAFEESIANLATLQCGPAKGRQDPSQAFLLYTVK
jgi:hypothetical protein